MPYDSPYIPQLCVLFGLSLWMTLELVNNIVNCKGAVTFVGRIMSMSALAEDLSVETPLIRRRIESRSWHRLGHGALLVIMLGTAFLLWTATAALVGALYFQLSPHLARYLANLALSAFVGMSFFLMLGSLWFGYWIKHADLRLTHLALICVGIGAALLVNL